MIINDIFKIQMNWKETKSHNWNMETDVIEIIDNLANENMEEPSIIVGYILDWACDKLYQDNEFKEKILKIKRKRKNMGKENLKARRYIFSYDLENKFQKTKDDIRFYNDSVFVNESIKQFMKEYK